MMSTLSPQKWALEILKLVYSHSDYHCFFMYMHVTYYMTLIQFEKHMSRVHLLSNIQYVLMTLNTNISSWKLLHGAKYECLWSDGTCQYNSKLLVTAWHCYLSLVPTKWMFSSKITHLLHPGFVNLSQIKPSNHTLWCIFGLRSIHPQVSRRVKIQQIQLEHSKQRQYFYSFIGKCPLTWTLDFS